MLQRFATERLESRHRKPDHFIRHENIGTVIHPCPCVFWDLNEAKAVYILYISEYYDALITSQVSSNVVLNFPLFSTSRKRPPDK